MMPFTMTRVEPTLPGPHPDFFDPAHPAPEHVVMHDLHHVHTHMAAEHAEHMYPAPAVAAPAANILAAFAWTCSQEVLAG